MQVLPAGMSEHLADGVTALCWCWVLRRQDGQVFGYTDLDDGVLITVVLVIGEAAVQVVCEASSGFTGSSIKKDLGLATGGLDATGALNSSTLSEDDLRSGKWDGAEVWIFRTNW